MPASRDEGCPDRDRSSGTSSHVADPVNRALVSLARRFDAAHALGADRCRVRGVRREDQFRLPGRARCRRGQCGTRSGRARSTALFRSRAHASRRYRRGRCPTRRAQALGTWAVIWSSPGGVPSCRSTAALAPIAEPHHSRECSVPPRRRGDGSRGLRRPGEEDHRSLVTESNSALRVPAQVPAVISSQFSGVSHVALRTF